MYIFDSKLRNYIVAAQKKDTKQFQQFNKLLKLITVRHTMEADVQKMLDVEFVLKWFILNLPPGFTFGFGATSHTLSQHVSLLSVDIPSHTISNMPTCFILTLQSRQPQEEVAGRKKIPIKINWIFSGIPSAIKSPNKDHLAAGGASLCFARKWEGHVIQSHVLKRYFANEINLNSVYRVNLNEI